MDTFCIDSFLALDCMLIRLTAVAGSDRALAAVVMIDVPGAVKGVYRAVKGVYRAVKGVYRVR